MANQKVLISNLQIIINNQLIAYVPNTLKYVGNMAETKVETLTTGGTSGIAVHSVDASKAKSQVTFEVRATEQIINLAPQWNANVGENVIELSSANGVVAEAFIGMSLLSIPLFNFGADKSFTLTFEGDSK